MRLKFPVNFKVDYPEKNSLYYSGVDKKIILANLMKSCDSYCMYCGKNIITDDKAEFNIEHSLEKSMQVDGQNFLENCKYNLSIACPSCNQKYKTRMIDSVSEELINVKVECLEKKCNEICDEYRKILDEYLTRNYIILQPNCIDDKLKGYTIDYNLIKHIFEPGKECTDESSIKFISEHIARFHLNREMYTQSILRICEKIYKTIYLLRDLGANVSVQNSLKFIKKPRYNNIMEKIFIEFIEEMFESIDELEEYCKLSIVLSYI